jgi:hypothetical protein
MSISFRISRDPNRFLTPWMLRVAMVPYPLTAPAVNPRRKYFPAST